MAIGLEICDVTNPESLQIWHFRREVSQKSVTFNTYMLDVKDFQPKG